MTVARHNFATNWTFHAYTSNYSQLRNQHPQTQASIPALEAWHFEMGSLHGKSGGDLGQAV
ncbi:MAG: hypothetical protein ACPG4T_24980, partial [Nannocystaceae bacterium]